MSDTYHCELCGAANHHVDSDCPLAQPSPTPRDTGAQPVPESADGPLPNELNFEQWYADNAFDYAANPIGSRDCGLQRAAWHAALIARADRASRADARDAATIRVNALREAATECEMTQCIWSLREQATGMGIVAYHLREMADKADKAEVAAQETPHE